MRIPNRWLFVLLSVGLGYGCLLAFGVAGESPEVRRMLFVGLLILVLYIGEPLPLGQLSMIALFILLVGSGAEVGEVMVGFASEAALVVLLGLFLNAAMAQTSITQRLVYAMLIRTRGSRKGVIGSILLMPIMTAAIIPATVIRTTLLIPVIQRVNHWNQDLPGSNSTRKRMIALAIGANISSLVLVTAAPANLVAIDLIHASQGVRISYLGWFLLMLPIWLLILPIAWWLLERLYPEPASAGALDLAQLSLERKALGELSKKDRRFLSIMALMVTLWILGPLHGLGLVFPIFLAVILLSLPRIGIIDWHGLKQLNLDVFYLVGATISLARILIDSGTIGWITHSLTDSGIAVLFAHPWLAVLATALLAQLLHLVVTNVNTAVITLLPMILGLSVAFGANPVMLALTVTASCVLCFLLAIESLASTSVLATGEVSQADFIRTGIGLTLASIVVVTLAALFWWPHYV